MKKSDFRKETLKHMKNLNKSIKEKADQWLAEQLFSTEEYKNAQKIGIVLAMNHEVDTYSIIKQIINQNKQAFVPATEYSTKKMTFQRLTDLSTLAVDEKGIKYVNAPTEKTDQLDLIIVPGVVFNNYGYRIGYGGGYFDKFLSQHRAATISLIYDIQLNNDFNTESHDEKVDRLIIAKTK
ncbi:5-formyltetrahydrofolate cyclo-ligase [Staphylococcus piscifermentans]|uniref:5-formyltetrahydrofolate cyclo-ligase n=1 Tax=Staphylococcus piscifermentans TaxID=70258 RepID=A0A239U1J7_9STAP|nr:5-formyltetrahydrofolate cyclo-ligase [Staphylococcus piscifermentans]RTX82769.1 5-formyltetrahydrofolate cyclo-ligase [Staphylococcus piscifermentans]GEP84724.1 5-formyltetrahydrofolate cyclo-ligase [Staphylococcus piscifermentans]SNV03870.1 5-formyltetrahydrofolate cyclo-ligase [Staphylococcus piscifermentans]